MNRWEVWRLDVATWSWIAWFAAFVVLETWTLASRSGQELSAHLRVLFTSIPVVWFVCLSLWVWAGVHLLFPRWERALLEVVR
jgi:hypothetical protein